MHIKLYTAILYQGQKKAADMTSAAQFADKADKLGVNRKLYLLLSPPVFSGQQDGKPVSGNDACREQVSISYYNYFLLK